MRTGRGAFTLVELLATIAIMAVLAIAAVSFRQS
jgi:prepilin-type N-terminal cleavage/methylation domain-containing protein